MPTQRPFFSNFLASFRPSWQQLPKSQSSISSPTGASPASTQTLWTSAYSTQHKPQQQQLPPSTPSDNATISPRPINSKPAYTTSSRPLAHNVSPQTHLSRSPSSSGLPTYGPSNKSSPSYPTCQETSRPWSESRPARRGSDSSSDSGGFREVKSGAGGGDRWFIGGKTAGGEEKYYKMSMVKRERSEDRISADRLSL